MFSSKTLMPLGLALSLMGGTFLSAQTQADPTVNTPTAQSEAEAFKALVRDVYFYAYPLVTMDVTMRQAINVPDATSVPRRAPINQFAHYRSYPDANAKEVVRFNFDTLYSFAWIDATQEPVILSLPDSSGRFYLAPLLDMWTDVYAVPGTRTTGNKAGDYAIVAPGWEGTLPSGVERINAPTQVSWLMTRVQTNGPSDYKNVHAFQDQLKLTPLSQWGKNFTPPVNVPVDKSIDNETPPQHLINAMDGVELFSRFAQLIKTIPPHANDYPIVHRMRALGLEAGKAFDVSRFTPEQLEVLKAVAKEGQDEILKAISTASIGIYKNGWNWTDNLGTYGTDYRRRALVALSGLGANLPEDALYPNSASDSEGQPYSGKNAYELRFAPGQLPPVSAFWSLTLYDQEGFQVPNELSRFAIGSYDKFIYESDGSLVLHLQHKAPDKARLANWLPAPEGDFQLMLRMYAPKPAALKGEWVAPAVTKVR